MSDTDLLLKVLAKDPHNIVVRSMLVDELMDVRDMNRGEAETKARTAIIAEVDAVNITIAARLMASKSPTAAELHELVALMLLRIRGSVARVLLIDAEVRPKLANPPRQQPWTAPGIEAVVGADWVIETARTHFDGMPQAGFVRRVTRRYRPTREIE